MEKFIKEYDDTQGKKYQIEFFISNNLLNINAFSKNELNLLDFIPFEGKFSIENLREKSRCFNMIQYLPEAIEFLLQIIENKKLIIKLDETETILKASWNFKIILREESFDLLLTRKVPKTKDEIVHEILEIKRKYNTEIKNLKEENLALKDQINIITNEVISLKSKISHLELDLPNTHGSKGSSLIDLNKAFEVTKFNDNTEPIRWITLLQDDRVATCSKDKSINIYNILTNKREISYKNAHSAAIFYITQLASGEILSGDGNGNIKTWVILNNRLNLKNEFINIHSSTIFCIIPLTYSRFASGSMDCTIKIFSSQSWTEIKTLNKHRDAIRALCQLKNGILVSGSREGDSCLYFWDLNNYQSINRIGDIYCNAFNMCELNDNKLVVGGEDNLYIVDTSRYILERKFTNSKLAAMYSITLLNDDFCIISNYIGFLLIVDLKDMVIIQNKQFHGDYIYNIIILNNYKKIITVSEDKSMKILKYYH